MDALGVTLHENGRNKAVLFYDTEQSEVQLYKNISNLLPVSYTHLDVYKRQAQYFLYYPCIAYSFHQINPVGQRQMPHTVLIDYFLSLIHI